MNKEGIKTNPETFEYAKENKKNMNLSEVRMWMILKGSSYNFRRQYVIGNFIVDFASLKNKIVIEVDGVTHDAKKGYDLERERRICESGYKILRFVGMVPFPDQEVFDFVWMKIKELEGVENAVLVVEN